MKQNESKMQAGCVKWFRYEYPHLKMLLFSTPNAAQRSFALAAKMKAEGMVSGVADLFLSVPRGEYHGLYLEAKYGKNDLTATQQEFKQAVQKHGYKHSTFWSFDEFTNVINSYLGVPVEKRVFYVGQ